MAWMTLARGTSLEEFRASQPSISELPKGTRLRLTIETPWYAPIAPLADLWGSEIVAQRLLGEGGAIVMDVEGVGLHTVIVHMEADPAWIIPLILAIAALAVGFAFLIASIKLDSEQITTVGKWMAVALIALAAVVLLKPKVGAKKELVKTT